MKKMKRFTMRKSSLEDTENLVEAMHLAALEGGLTGDLTADQKDYNLEQNTVVSPFMDRGYLDGTVHRKILLQLYLNNAFIKNCHI
jgi:hypothetical protein